IDAADCASLIFGVDVIGIRGILENPEAVATINVFPARIVDASGIRRVSNPTTVILQPAVNMIGIGVIHAYMVELRNREIGLVHPAGAPVLTAPEAAIIRGKHNIRIIGIDPDVMEITMGCAADGTKALSAVHA